MTTAHLCPRHADRGQLTGRTNPGAKKCLACDSACSGEVYAVGDATYLEMQTRKEKK